MAKISAGMMMYRRHEGGLQVLLVHPGGPLWAKRDLGAWSIPKGEVRDDEQPLSAARREFEEELGIPALGDFLPLGSITQRGGKTVYAWAFQGDCDPAALRSNTFSMEWPPRSGKQRQFPEVDRADFFPIHEAREKLNAAQVEFVNRLEVLIRPQRRVGGR
jgi:predicted NUDIX family NTP pyrophosphohydrolase